MQTLEERTDVRRLHNIAHIIMSLVTYHAFPTIPNGPGLVATIPSQYVYIFDYRLLREDPKSGERELARHRKTKAA